MTVFRYGGFPGNNQRVIKYKNFICLSNLQFNYTYVGSLYMSKHATTLFRCNRTLHFVQYTRVFLWQNIASPLGEECQKAIQSVISNFRRHVMCMSLICGEKALTDFTKHVILRRKLR